MTLAPRAGAKTDSATKASTETIKVYLVDDHRVVRAGIHALLAQERDITVVGEADNGEQARLSAPKVAPDVMLVDLSLPDVDGLELVKGLAPKMPNTRFIALTMYDEAERARTFLQAGGSGYVPKAALATDLLDAVRAVQRGEHYITPQLLGDLTRDLANPFRPVALTKREEAVVRGIAEGYTYKEVAKGLSISGKTVATYRERASEKLGLASRTELIAGRAAKHLMGAPS